MFVFFFCGRVSAYIILFYHCTSNTMGCLLPKNIYIYLFIHHNIFKTSNHCATQAVRHFIQVLCVADHKTLACTPAVSNNIAHTLVSRTRVYPLSCNACNMRKDACPMLCCDDVRTQSSPTLLTQFSALLVTEYSSINLQMLQIARSQN